MSQSPGSYTRSLAGSLGATNLGLGSPATEAEKQPTLRMILEGAHLCTYTHTISRRLYKNLNDLV